MFEFLSHLLQFYPFGFNVPDPAAPAAPPAAPLVPVVAAVPAAPVAPAAPAAAAPVRATNHLHCGLFKFIEQNVESTALMILYDLL